MRRVGAGEEITITVSGRPSAQLVPARRMQWRSWTEIADLFRGLHGWMKKADIEDDARPGPTAAESAELREAKKRIRLLEQVG